MLLFNKKKYKQKTLSKLIELAQENNFDAIEELIKRVQNNVYISFYYLADSNEDILDLTQETLLKMVKNIKTLKDKSKFKPWLNQIITRIFYDHIRTKNRKPQIIPIDKNNDTEKKTITEIPCKSFTPEEHSLNDELNCMIEKSIHKLPETFRLAIILREFQGLSYEEIAEITKTNIGTVKSRIARARTKLQEDLKKYIA